MTTILKHTLLVSSFFILSNVNAMMNQSASQKIETQNQTTKTCPTNIPVAEVIDTIENFSGDDVDNASNGLRKVHTTMMHAAPAQQRRKVSEVMEELNNLVATNAKFLELKTAFHALCEYEDRLDDKIKKMEKDASKEVGKPKDPVKEAFFTKVKLFSSQLKEFTVDAAQIALDLAKVGGCVVALVFVCRVIAGITNTASSLTPLLKFLGVII